MQIRHGGRYNMDSSTSPVCWTVLSDTLAVVMVRQMHGSHAESELYILRNSLCQQNATELGATTHLHLDYSSHSSQPP